MHFFIKLNIFLKNNEILFTADQTKSESKEKVKSSHTRTITSAINSTFKNSLKEFEKSKLQLEIGDYVLSRMTGFLPWPSKITSFTKDKRRAMCYFYGSHNNGPVGVKQIIPFKDGFETIQLAKLRHLTDFNKGIREIEIENRIPEEMSSLREIAVIE